MICALGLAFGVSGMHCKLLPSTTLASVKQADSYCPSDLGLVGTRWYVPIGKTRGFTQGQKTSTVLTLGNLTFPLQIFVRFAGS